jgi:hypothetical protein
VEVVGLTMAERRAVTRQVALRYRKVLAEGRILDELCALIRWMPPCAPVAGSCPHRP